MQWAAKELGSLDEQFREMWQLVEQDTGDPRMREILAHLVRRAAVPARNTPALARAVQRLVQTHVTYLREKPETYVAPLRTLHWRVGDCDDQAIAVCGLLRSAAVPCRLVVVGHDKGMRGAPIEPRHVYSEALTAPRQWTALETVRALPMNWRAEDFYRRKGYRVHRWTHGDVAQ